MSTINELYLEIEDLEKQIEDEPRQKLKRKLKIKKEIKELKERKIKYGLKSDFASVHQAENQIKKLENEISGGKIPKYEYEIKLLKGQISSIIVTYFKKGHNLEYIFQKENIPQNIQDEWLSKCNFGETTGILFIDEIDDDEKYNWRYYNPMLEIEYKSETLEDLEHQIKSYKKVFLVFNKNLADKTYKKDLKLIQDNINAHISDLEYCRYATDISSFLEMNRNKLSKTQINNLTEVIISNPHIHNFTQSLQNILRSNNEANEGIYEKIINSRINHLNECDLNQYHNLLKDLNNLKNKFSENQINNFYNIILDLNYPFNCHDFILNILKCKPELYINAQLNELAKVTYYSEASEILNNLYYYYSEDFNENQLTELCNIALTNYQVYTCHSCKNNLRNILSENKNKIDEELYEKTIQTTEPESYINAQLNNLAKVTYDYREARLILNELYHYSTDFTKTQLTQLCNIALTNDQVYNCDYCKSSLRGILSENKDKIDKELYEKTILKNKL